MPILVKLSVTRMELWTGALSCWKRHWPDLTRADLFRRNLLKPQHSNPNPIPLANQLWCIDFFPPPTLLILPHVTSLNLLCHSKPGRKAVWSIPYSSVAFFPSLKQNFIAYRSSKVSWHPDCIFEIHQLWQSGFSRVYSNSFIWSWNHKNWPVIS